MNRRILASLNLLIVAASLGVVLTGCGLEKSFAEGWHEGEEADSGSGVSATTDCHEAGKICEGFVTALCDAGERCGETDFDSCTQRVLAKDLACERGLRRRFLAVRPRPRRSEQHRSREPSPPRVVRQARVSLRRRCLSLTLPMCAMRSCSFASHDAPTRPATSAGPCEPT